MKKAVIIGAGQTGRGFIAPIVEDNGYHLVFLDKDQELTEKLAREKAYKIRYFGGEKQERTVRNFDVFSAEGERALQEIAEADVVFVSVFASHVGELSELFKKAAARRTGKKMTIFCCENGVNVKRPLVEAGVDGIISEGIIFCTTVRPDGEKLDLISQDYPELPVDGKVEGLTVELEGMPHEMNFPSLIQRKIYTYNFISGVVAYLGSYKGYEEYGEAANDRDISAVIERLVPVISRIIAQEYSVPYEVQLAFTEKAVAKFKNREIYDTIGRNARQAARKLGETERLLTPLRLAYKYNDRPEYIEVAIAGAIYYGATEEAMPVEPVLENIKKIADERHIMHLYDKFQKKVPLADIIEYD